MTESAGRGPFHRIVVLGESNAYGMCASRHAYEWNAVLGRLMEDFQDGESELLNRALPSECISPRSPGYEMSAKPSLLERHRRHGLAEQPDLLIISQGLNDMRSGMSVGEFAEDMTVIVEDVLASSPAEVVLVGIYPQVYGQGFNDPVVMPTFAKGSHERAACFNDALAQIAAAHEVLFVDTLAILGGCDWLIHPDCCHLNDLGHVLLGHAVFAALVQRFPALAARTQRIIREADITVANSGGANSNAEMRALWGEAASRFGIGQVADRPENA